MVPFFVGVNYGAEVIGYAGVIVRLVNVMFAIMLMLSLSFTATIH
jgi:hypothetical protein